MTSVIGHASLGKEEDAFLRANSRTFLIGVRADGFPTAWPMVGLYPGDGLEFSTYGRSQKVRDFERNPNACCVVAPEHADQALVLRGTAAVADGQHEPRTGAASPPSDVRVADGISDRARDRMKSGKRVVLHFVPSTTEFIPGMSAEESGL